MTSTETAEALGYYLDHVRRRLQASIIKGTKAIGLVWLIDQAEADRAKREQKNGRLYVDRPRPSF